VENIQQNYLKKMNDAFSVSSLNSYIKKLLEQDDLLYDLKVEGEISYYKIHTSGHIYFALKDENSFIKCVLFKGSYRGNPPEFFSGDKVVVRGSVGVYSPRGEYQIYARVIQKSGTGDLYQKYIELKEKLEKEGLFSKENKKEIPQIINRIGIVSGKTAAGFKDMVKILQNENFDIILKNSRVQGIGAGVEIANGIKKLNEYGNVDVIIIGRGGGSIEDLWCFNEEVVARAVYESRIPVISAVGHEIDIVISDLVADLRAETPTAAAEFLVKRKNQLRQNFNKIKIRLISDVRKNLLFARKNLEITGVFKLKNAVNQSIFNYRNKCEKFRKSLIGFKSKLNENSLKIDYTREKIIGGLRLTLDKYYNRLKFAGTTLNLSNPENMLDKGYAIIKKDNKILKSVKNSRINDIIEITLKDGKLEAGIKSKKVRSE